MKTSVILLLAAFISLKSFPVNWTPVGPDTADISRVCFTVALQRYVLCADRGFYLYHYGNNTCTFHTYGGLRVTGSTHFAADKILVAMGSGTYSDGIYTFDLNSQNFGIVEWMILPAFLYFDENTSTWWCGSSNGGMMKSTDGETWTAVAHFAGRKLACMDSWGPHLVVSETDSDWRVHHSTDGGNTWEMTAEQQHFTDIRFDSQGNLCAIFPGNSYSSGIYGSENYGQSWMVMQYCPELSTVGFDSFDRIFAGWEQQGGLAFYDPEAPGPGFFYINENLPNLNLNNIQVNPVMSAPALFVCTDGGVYFSLDYTGTGETAAVAPEILISPNPADYCISIRSTLKIDKLQLRDISGKNIRRWDFCNKDVQLDVSQLPAGIWLLTIDTGTSSTTRKIVVR